MAIYLDTGVAIAPASRPSAFTPPTAVTLTTANDTTIAITPATRPDVFDDISGTLVVPDPGGSL